MTPQNILAAAKGLAQEIGSQSSVYVAVDAHPYGRDGAARLSVWANGMQDNLTFTVSSDDWDDLFSDAHAKWREIKASVHAATIRKMALVIINLTATPEGCTDAGLRMAGFAADQIASLGADACAEADKIAAGGPFAISSLAGANAA